MKILMLTEKLRLGGAETLAVALAGALARSPGMSVSFAAAEGPLRERLDPRVRFFPVPDYSAAAAAGLTVRLAAILKEERPDVVHAHSATIGVLAWLAAKLAGRRAVFVLTHHNVETSRLASPIAARILDLVYDRIIAISRSKREQLVASGIPASKVVLIPNFVDCGAIERRIAAVDRVAVRAELGLAPDQKVVIVAGRLIPGKRVDRFIEILARCRPRVGGRPVGLILGEGPERAKLEALARLHAPDARVVFLGYQADIYRYLAVASAFLFPSDSEVLPMALIESFAAGIPVVCSDIPGNAEIVEDGRSGCLVRGDDAEYASRLAELLADDVRRKETADRARAAARDSFDEAVVVGRIAALYDAMAAPDA